LSLSAVLRGVVSQDLFKRIDKKGRCAAIEILIATPSVRHLIREGKTDRIPQAIREGKGYGMQLLDDAIMDLLDKGWVDPGEAFMKANDKTRFKALLKTPPVDFTEV
jgi:twitching motility protein PilT